MNKLLQHLIDSGDVSHKVLPSLMKFQIRGEVPAGLKPIPRSGGDIATRKPVIQMTAEEAKKRQLQMMAQKAVANQATVTSPLMTALPASREATIERNRQYAAATGKRFDPNTGAVSPLLSDNTDRMMRRAQENIVDPMFELEMALSGAKLVGQGLKAAGKYAVENTALKNASKSVFPTFGQGNSNSGLGNFLMSRGIEVNPVAIAYDHASGLVRGGMEQFAGLMRDLRIAPGTAPRRPFFETFPVTKAQKNKVIAMQDQAFNDAKEFTEKYWYADNAEHIRPVLEDKMRALLPDLKRAKVANNLERNNWDNPFNIIEDRLVKNTTWGSGREGLDKETINYLNQNRGRIGGVNLDDKSITLRNKGLYYKTPKEIAETVAHESGHTGQKFGTTADFTQNSNFAVNQSWNDVITKYDPTYEYFTSNVDTELGQRFQKALVKPSTRSRIKTWRSSPGELHSEMMSGKFNLYRQGLKQGLSEEEMIRRVTDPSEKELDWILKNMRLDRHFKKGTSLEEKRSLMKLLPAAVPAVAGASMLDEKAEGGEAKEYKGSSIVDYLATKGYSGKKAFRKELANKYGVENYDYSAAKNTELLNRMRQNDDLLEAYEQTAAPISAESLEQIYRTNLQAKKQENYNNIRRRMALDMGYDPLAGQSQFEQAQYPDLSLVPKSPYGKNSLVNGLQGTGRQPQPAPAPATKRPANFQYVQPGKPSTQNNFEQFPGYPEQAAKAPAAAPDWRYVQPGKAVPQNPFQQFPAYPTRQVGDLPKKTTAKAAAKALEEDIDEQNWFEKAGSGVADGFEKVGSVVGDGFVIAGRAIEDGMEYTSGLFNGLQRKWDSTQKEDPRSINKITTPIKIDRGLPGKTAGNKKDSASAIPYGYKQLYAVADSKNPKDSLVSFMNTFDNEQGGRYYIGHKAKEVTDAGAQRSFDNAEGVAHFLRDSDILPGQKITPKSWEVSKGYTYHTTSPGKTVSAAGFDDPDRYRMLYRPNPNNDGTYLTKYVKNKDISPIREAQLRKEGWEVDFTVNAQHKFSDIAWEKDGPSTGYAAASKWLPLKDGKHTYIPYKNKDGFSRFSGGSGIYLFKDPKTGKQVGVDVSGSVNTIKKIGDELIKTYGVKPDDLELAYHDMGSYSAKPKSHNGKLDYKQWLNYNTYNRGFSGAPMIIPKKNNGGPIVDPRGQWAHPGKVTRIPSNQITMQGVPYPVLGVGNNGQRKMMYPGQDYHFGGATYVDEFPMMEEGGDSSPVYQDLPNITIVGSKDKSTRDFYNGLINKLSASENYKTDNPFIDDRIMGKYLGIMNLGKKYGFPKVSKEDNIGIFKNASGHYNPVNKTIHANDVDTWISELAHHVQMKDNVVNKGLQWLGNDLVQYIKQPIASLLGQNLPSPYKTPGTVEHEAHSVIEPKLRKLVKDSYDSYKASPISSNRRSALGINMPTYQIRGQVQRAAADNTRHSILTRSQLTKAESDYTKNQFNKAKEFHEQWMNSPMYNKMITASDPENAKAITDQRKKNIKDVKFNYNNIQPNDKPNTGGYSNSQTGNVTFLPRGYGVRGLGTHELSHSIDRPEDYNIFSFYKNMISDAVFGTNKGDFTRTIPNRDVKKIQSISSYNKLKDTPIDEKWFKYVTEPTETRARLNDIRQQARENNLYDPFTQKVTPDIYNKLRGFKFDEGKNRGFDALEQLRDVYTDEQIQNLLNSVSKNNSQVGMNQAKYGGGLLSRTVSCSSCGHSWKSVEGGGDPLHCHKCGGMVKMQLGGISSLSSVPLNLLNKALGLFGNQPNKVPQVPQKEVVPFTLNVFDKMSQKYNEKYRSFYDKWEANNKLDPENKSKNPVVLNTGRFRGARVEPTMIDDLIKAAKLQGVDPWLMVALAGRESTFGSGTAANKDRYTHKDRIVSGWTVTEGYVPPTIASFLADKKVPGANTYKSSIGWTYDIDRGQIKSVEDYLNNHPEIVQSYYKQLEKTPDVGNLGGYDLAAKRIKEKGLKSYNPGDPNYSKLVMDDMSALKNDKAMAAYMKSRGFKNGGMIKMQGGGEMIRRADGSYSKRGLWDNIRANKGSGKKPTKQMLEQERKIKKAQWGLEFKVDNWLGKPMEKAEMMADKFTKPGEDQTDNFRHPMAGRYASEAIQKKTGNIPVLSNILGFIGGSAAGLGHELLDPNRGPDKRPYTLGQTIREGAEDQFNNMVGALIGSLPFMSATKKTQTLKYLSDNNLIPDGYGRNSDNMYFKKMGGNVPKPFNSKQPLEKKHKINVKYK